MAELKTHKSRIGKGLINMLMFQMYGDEKLIYREYVQNARDAINDAVNHGILGAITIIAKFICTDCKIQMCIFS